MWARAAGSRGLSLVRHFTSSFPKPYTVPEGSWGANRAARLELAAAYRGLDLLGLNEGVSNHLSVMAPRANGEGDVMLVFPEGLHWKEVTASNLVGLDSDAQTVEGEGSPETTASCIHLSIHKMRSDIRVIMHTHQPYVSALASLEDSEMKMVHQNSLRFWKDIAYDPHYSGVAYAFEEGERMGKILGDKHVLIMGNHGVLTVAPTVSMAFEMLYYLERAAMTQILAMSTKQKLREISEEVIKAMFPEYMKRAQNYADVFFYAYYRLLKQSQPDFEQ
ncbi:putative aldolase class 2 protein RP493 [Procambarus clarkii]|uniref:putative aldolase class 2 protein RP493 n=1 Tax=Procambarus clarkii TaxID=6728 RepID=UPI0037447206